MPKFIIELSLDGYETEEDEIEACKFFIEEALDFSASSVSVIDPHEFFVAVDSETGEFVKKNASIYHERYGKGGNWSKALTRKIGRARMYESRPVAFANFASLVDRGFIRIEKWIATKA